MENQKKTNHNMLAGMGKNTKGSAGKIQDEIFVTLFAPGHLLVNFGPWAVEALAGQVCTGQVTNHEFTKHSTNCS